MSAGRAVAAAVLIAFAAYLAGILPYIYWADSGELTLGGSLLALSHPPSFPVYALLLKTITLLPLGDLAFKTSLLSALCAALAAGCVYFLAWRLCAQPILGRWGHVPAFPALGAAVAVATLCANRQGWEVSVRQEVYTLSFLLSLAILAAVLAWSRERRPGFLIAAGFLFGLGLGNHSLLVLALFPPILGFLLSLGWRRVLEPRVLAWTVAAFLLGVSSYLYLPLRSSTDPFLDWNDPQRVGGFIDSFTKRSETTLFIGESSRWSHLATFGAALVDGFTPWLVGLAALGFGPLWNRSPRLLLFLLALWACNVATVVMAPRYDWDNPDIPGYLLLSFAIYAVLIGEGVRRLLHPLLVKMPSRMAGWTAVAAGVGVTATAWFTADARVPDAADDRARAFGLEHLAATPAGGLLLTKTDPVTFLAWYLQEAEGRRPDVLVVNRKGLGDARYRASLLKEDPLLFGGEAVPEATGGASSMRRVGQERIGTGQEPAGERLESATDGGAASASAGGTEGRTGLEAAAGAASAAMPALAPDLKAVLPEGDAPSAEVAGLMDASLALREEVAQILRVNLPRRPVTWESGTDNRWVLSRSRPRGPLFEVGLEPLTLTVADHRRNLAYQQRFRAMMTQPSLSPDPRAGRAMEVVMFNLINALRRKEAPPEAVIAEAFGQLWRDRPQMASAGANYAYELFAIGDYPRAEAAYRRLIAEGPDRPLYWKNLGVVLVYQGRLEDAAGVFQEGLRRYPANAELEENLRKLERARNP